MNIALLGFDLQGRSAYEYWNRDGNSLTICDRNPNVVVPEGADSQLGDGYLQNLDRFDLLVRTPGLHPRDIVAANPDALDILDKVTTNTDEFLRVCPTKNVIGVTGTKGKGTTSTLIAKMLEASGEWVHLGGNIGIPPLELLKNDIQPDEWVVLELANFQLIDLKHSPHIAVCLMVVPEHMDWHTDMQEYVTAKAQLFRWQSENGIAIHYARNEHSSLIAAASPGSKIPYMEAPGAKVIDGVITIAGQQVCRTDEIKLLGEHNWQNICAAVTAVWQVTRDCEAMRKVATTFSGLEHRLEFVRELSGVKYYDDSFGTTPETAIVAMQAFEEPKVVILGGSDKGATYESLAETVARSNVRQTILIGVTAPAIERALRAAGFSNIQTGAQNMAEIVAQARSAAQLGDTVLLSTGCASFDMFRNYKDRGNQFKQIVSEL
ncbi:MAG TPA: UDP-N-acetylmuramoyl-L-alanine--D-glutamate ligase [Candidatus Limnocylindrales bacterium]|nr:UDP-N-acetylmuramoyl-L-alanine--D-glutamate ligase [Candidatus Limnocylindrales bacterium]